MISFFIWFGFEDLKQIFQKKDDKMTSIENKELKEKIDQLKNSLNSLQ
ncbi:hypothetical protein [Candidatus Phytoplasma solani]